MSAKDRMLTFLRKRTGRNTFSTDQARNYFNIWNVAARIYELRLEGWPVYTNTRHRSDGSPVAVYRLGTPSRSMRAAARENGIKLQRA